MHYVVVSMSLQRSTTNINQWGVSMTLSIMDKATYLQRLIYEVSRTTPTDTHPSTHWNYEYQQAQAERAIDTAINELCQALLIAGKRPYNIEEV